MVLQVGTTNYQSTRGESFRTTVQRGIRTGVTPPKTGLMGLAETLSSINPTLQKIVGLQIDKAKQEGVLEGQNQILGSTPTEINKIKKELEKKEGKRFARNFIGGNIYTQYGIEKQLAINLGNASEAKTKKFFNDYVVDVPLPDGTVIQQPLSQFDINSKEFQGAINEFKETSLLNTRGIRPEIVNEHLLPKQNLALAKIFSDQETKRAEAKIEQANLLFNNSVINSWFSIDNFNDSIELNLIDDNYTTEDRRNNNGLSQAEFLSLQELQLNVDSMVKLGLSESVSPASMLTLIKTNALQILDYYENNNLDMDMAQEEIDEYIDWIGNLKVTNGLPLRTFYIQGGENKIEDMMSDINKKKGEAIKNQKTYNKLETQKTITNTLNNLNFSFFNFENQDGSFNIEKATAYYKQVGNTLDFLASEYPEQIDFLYKQYDLRNFSVDEFFFDLEARYDQGEISQEDALKNLTDVMMALGPNASKEDRTKYTNLKKYLGATDGKSLEKRFPEVANLKKYGIKTVGKTNNYGVSFIGDQPTVDKMEDLNLELNRLVKKHGGISTVFTTDDGKKMTVKNWYLGELRKIKNPKTFGKYDFYDDAYDFKLSVPIEGEVDDDSGNNNGATVNLDQQKILIYDKETKLFNEVDPSKFKTNANTIVVSMNDGLTQDGLELKDELNIDSFKNFNYKLYNQNFENKKTIDTNKKLLEDDLTFNDPFANEIKPSLGVTDGSMIAYNFPTNNQSPEVEPSIINNVVKLAKDFNTNTKEFTFDTVAKIGKVESSKNFVDFFLDDYIANNAEQNQDLTNLLTEDDQNFLKQETNEILNTNIAKTLLEAKNYQGIQDYVREQLIMSFGLNSRLGLQNSLGHGNYLDAKHYDETGEIKFNNTYLFETEDSQTGGSDLLIRLPYSVFSTIINLPLPDPAKKRFLELVNNAPRRYVVDKIGEDKLKNILDNPYRYTINLGKV